MSRNVSSPCCDSSNVSQCALHIQNWNWNWSWVLARSPRCLCGYLNRFRATSACPLSHIVRVYPGSSSSSSSSRRLALFVLLSVSVCRARHCLDFWQPCQGFRLPKNVIFIVSAHLGAIEVVAAPTRAVIWQSTEDTRMLRVESLPTRLMACCRANRSYLECRVFFCKKVH